MGRWVPLVLLESQAAEPSFTHNPPAHLLPPLPYHPTTTTTTTFPYSVTTSIPSPPPPPPPSPSSVHPSIPSYCIHPVESKQVARGMALRLTPAVYQPEALTFEWREVGGGCEFARRVKAVSYLAERCGVAPEIL